MGNHLFQFGINEFKEFDKYFNDTFKMVYPLTRRIIYENANKPKNLYKMLCEAISNKTRSDYPFLFRFSYQQSGKRFRKICKIAAAIHLLQTSTFVIDDIFDKSNKRRDKKTIYNSYGANNAIITGELLQAISLNVIISEMKKKFFPNRIYVISLFNEIIKDVYVGQYLDIYQSSKPYVSANQYYKMISLTTGKFLSDIAKVGATLANLPNSYIESISKFGYFYGMALQICDDIIDVTNSPSITGKTFACDIKCRRLRLPVILALELSSKGDRNYLMQFITHENNLTFNKIRKIIKLIKRCGSIDKCNMIAGQYIYRAIEAISVIENKLSKNMLRLLALSLLRDIGVAK